MGYITNGIKHFHTITRHRHLVFAHSIKAGIPFRGLLHDLSKYSPEEFLKGAKYYIGTKSPNEGERRDYGYSVAWMHHKGRNKHHFEYWTDYNPNTKKIEPVKMPLKYVKEMFCDRVAASKIYQGKSYTNAHPLAYFINGKSRRIIDQTTSDLLEKMLVILSEQGEEAAWKYIRKLKKY